MLNSNGNKFNFFNSNYTLQIKNASFEDAGNYECDVVNDLGGAVAYATLYVGCKFIYLFIYLFIHLFIRQKRKLLRQYDIICRLQNDTITVGVNNINQLKGLLHAILYIIKKLKGVLGSIEFQK